MNPQDFPPLFGSYSSNSDGQSSQTKSYKTEKLSKTPENVPDPQMMVINHKLNGNNYLQWSQSVLRYIRGRRKEKYINGEASQPKAEDSQFDTWFAENNQVMTWLCNSMTDEISESYLLADTAKEIWDAAKRTYSSMNNTAALLQLKRQLRDLQQREMTVTQYYSTLQRIWQQLDLFEVHPWKDVEDAQYYKQLVEQGRIHDFLLGLNDAYEEIRGRIMGIKPLPSLFEVFNQVQFEESRKQLTQRSQVPTEGSALVTKGGGPSEHKEKKWNKHCNYCKMKGHTKDECWKLHGKPPHVKSKSQQEGRSNFTETEQNDDQLSKEEMQLLRKILEKQNKSQTTPNVNLVQSGNSIVALNTVMTADDTWIVDSGATDHMTGNRGLFKTLRMCHENLRVKVANGVVTNVAGIGSVVITECLEIHNVLFVPDLTCNLISVSKLIKSKQCRVLFNDIGCVFQDLNSGKMIGSSKEWDGLYYLEGLHQKNSGGKRALASSNFNNEDVFL